MVKYEIIKLCSIIHYNGVITSEDMLGTVGTYVRDTYMRPFKSLTYGQIKIHYNSIIINNNVICNSLYLILTKLLLHNLSIYCDFH